jgi:hypothetical protein
MSKRDDLALEVCKTVPKTQLIAATLGIIQQRLRLLGVPEEFDMEDLDMDAALTYVIQTSTIKQLKLLRKIALGLAKKLCLYIELAAIILAV